MPRNPFHGPENTTSITSVQLVRIIKEPMRWGLMINIAHHTLRAESLCVASEKTSSSQALLWFFSFCGNSLSFTDTRAPNTPTLLVKWVPFSPGGGGRGDGSFQSAYDGFLSRSPRMFRPQPLCTTEATYACERGGMAVLWLVVTRGWRHTDCVGSWAPAGHGANHNSVGHNWTKRKQSQLSLTNHLKLPKESKRDLRKPLRPIQRHRMMPCTDRTFGSWLF